MMFSFFKHKELIEVGHCIICGAPITAKRDNDGNVSNISGKMLNDYAYICKTCIYLKELNHFNTETLDSVTLLTRLKNNGFYTPDVFSPNKRIMDVDILNDLAEESKYPVMELDENRKLFNIPYIDLHVFSKTHVQESIHSYKELVDFELIDSGRRIADSNSLLGAAIGGLTFGGAGAIVGAGARKNKSKDKCTTLSIKLTLNNMDNPTLYIDFIGIMGKTTGYVMCTA